jgi:hypothetical protein
MAANHARTSLEWKQVKLTHAFLADKKAPGRTGFSLFGLALAKFKTAQAEAYAT